MQIIDKAKAVLKTAVEEYNVAGNQNNKIQTMKRLLEEVEAEKVAAK